MPDGQLPVDALLGFEAEHATERVPTASPEQSVGEARTALATGSFDCVADLVVLEDQRLIGLVTIERLLSADGRERISEVMDAHPPLIHRAEREGDATARMVRHGESAIALVDSDGRFKGLIPPARMLAALVAAHDEDLARLGGYLASTKGARLAAEEPISRRLWHRLPWLVVGLVGAMASAVLVGAFERQLDDKVLLAFFVPGVVYLADAVGTQTETLLIRGLSVGIDFPVMFRREAVTGLIAGLLIGAAFYPFAILVWSDASVALAVALALVASCSIATVVAMVLPWVLQRLGADPAFGSGPLATIIQDLLSIAVYLGIAIPLAT
jgi:magnesium transporter